MIHDFLMDSPRSAVPASPAGGHGPRKKQFNFFCRLWTVVCGLFFFAGCATVYNPATQKKELILIDSAQEVGLGRGMSEEIIKKDKPMLQDPARQRYVNQVGLRVAQVSDRRDIIFRFAVLDSPDLNAFALPGGYVFIYRGLLDKIDEPELAAILAHEVGHVAAKHSVKKLQAALGYDILVAIALAGLSPGHPAIAQNAPAVTNVIFNLLERGYSREDEFFADKLAVTYTRRAGYDPAALVRVFALLNEDKGPGGRVFETLSTHPRMDERIRKVKEEIGKTENPVV
jgi:predicted Zn-dependent protease